MVALSSVAEWILSIGWVAYMSTISYDLYNIGIVVEIWKVAGDSSPANDDNLSIWENQRSAKSLQLVLPHAPCCANKDWKREKQR
jgi:hypothetical protein